jgi:hypothetical protein
MKRLARASVRMRSAVAAISCMAFLVIAGWAPPVAAQEAGGKPARASSARETKNRKAKAKSRKDKRAEPTQAAPTKPDEAQVVRESAVNDAEAERKSQAARDAAADASQEDVRQEDVRKEGDSEVKVMEFSGLDIEGQLKTPQMLYFLNRLRAEFGRPDLPHRSFMPELSRATKEKAF